MTFRSLLLQMQDEKIKAREDRFKGELQAIQQPKAEKGKGKGGVPSAPVMPCCEARDVVEGRGVR